MLQARMQVGVPQLPCPPTRGEQGGSEIGSPNTAITGSSKKKQPLNHQGAADKASVIECIIYLYLVFLSWI